jgi:hypothetical protein
MVHFHVVHSDDSRSLLSRNSALLGGDFGLGSNRIFTVENAARNGSKRMSVDCDK